MRKVRWVRVVGDGLAWMGPCYVTDIVFWPDANGDYVDVYDGRDASSGEKVFRIEVHQQYTWQVHFTPGIRFDVGIYLDGKDDAVETTVVFRPEGE